MKTLGVNMCSWRKSSYSTGDGGNCVEVGIAWRKSRYSTGDGGQCVEVGAGPTFVGIRDTKNRALGQLTIAPKTWRAFIASRHVTGS